MIAAAASAPAARTTNDVPFQPAVGTLTYVRTDGSRSTFRFMPFIKTPGDWNEPYASLADALRAANAKSRMWEGNVTFGVVKAADGAHLIRPLESERGRPFAIDGPTLDEIGVRQVLATATEPTLLGVVGLDKWIDFTDSGKRVDVEPAPLATR